MRYVVVSAVTGRVHWHGDPGLLQQQVADAGSLERTQRHASALGQADPASGPFGLRSVSAREFRDQLLQVGALLLQGSSASALVTLRSAAS